MGGDKTVTVLGSAAQTLVGITAVQARVDGGEWIAATAVDGLFDGPRESFKVTTGALSTGKHTIEVEAFNAAGQKSTEKVEVAIP